MRYREYKGYLIVKNFVTDSYLVKKDGKTLYYGISPESFGKLKKAKALLTCLRMAKSKSRMTGTIGQKKDNEGRWCKMKQIILLLICIIIFGTLLALIFKNVEEKAQLLFFSLWVLTIILLATAFFVVA